MELEARRLVMPANAADEISDVIAVQRLLSWVNIPDGGGDIVERGIQVIARWVADHLEETIN